MFAIGSHQAGSCGLLIRTAKDMTDLQQNDHLYNIESSHQEPPGVSIY